MHHDAPSLGMEAPQEHQGLLEEEHAALDLFRRAREPGDERAREAMAQHWHGLLLSWLRRHPAARLALEYGPPERYVTAALNRFWQATMHSKRSSSRCATLADILAYLRCCLNSALLDAVRQAHTQQEVSARTGAEDISSPSLPRTPADYWKYIKQTFPKRRERLLVELRYVRGERPEGLVASHPREFPTVQEVSRLERKILKGLCPGPPSAPVRLLDDVSSTGPTEE